MKELELHFGDAPLGRLRVDAIRGREVFSFAYDADFPKRGDVPALDPDLAPFPGEQRPNGKELFGFLGDISPDRWGRRLILRREALLAGREGRPTRTLMASDFLVGAHDLTRAGAVRVAENGEFVSSDASMSVPPWSELRRLEECARRVDADEEVDAGWLDVLLAPGSSLGGARPKANVADADGSLWIAKFPSARDEWNVGAWEFLLNRLAREAKLSVPEARTERLSKAGSTFFSRRFDRDGATRVHYASAMTMAGAVDGEEGKTYADVAEFLVREGASPDEDLAELWGRVVFSRLVGSTDDHLRNHGYLLRKEGWRLAPMFDVNPNPDGGYPALDLVEGVPGESRDELLDAAEFFRLDRRAAERRFEEISGVVSGWRAFARNLGVARKEIARMEGAFRTMS